MNATDHADLAIRGGERLSFYQSGIFISIVCREGVRFVHLARHVFVEQGGRQLRRFCVAAITQQGLDVRPVGVSVGRTGDQSAVQRHVHLGERTV
jgi:hypothetical protein